jgi:hypothetical protein
MAEDTQQDAKQKRADNRERRRSMTAEPFERLHQAAESESSSSSGSTEIRETLKRAGITAAAAAAIGAAKPIRNETQPDRNAARGPKASYRKT